jgi:DNA helicase HerA-like ATPase
VFRARAADFPDGLHVEGDRAVIGQVPNSNFPVHVGLPDLVTHNAAILGVTGSGKSWLAFKLIEHVARLGIKVLVLDVTRQHWEYLQALNPRAIPTANDVGPWLNDPASAIGIYQFANVQDSFPRATADFVSAVFAKLNAETHLQAGVDVPAKVWVVLEEAHSLIPEWNQVAMEGDKQQVNRTARVLLQGRKFGLGALIISQRTANVTKTMLNQCNTVFAMQSFDQTGLDFLRNYMGEEYAQTISTLPTRHCILVGKASSSTRPIMVHVTDLAGHWGTGLGGGGVSPAPPPAGSGGPSADA